MSHPPRRPSRRLGRVAVLASFSLIAAVHQAVPAGAVPGTPVPSGSSVTAPVDYFTNAWGDPMDFNNQEDLYLRPGFLVMDGTSSISGGQLHLQGVRQLILLRGDPGAIPTSAVRDPRQRTLNADVYTRISFRMHSDRAAAGAIGYRSCDKCTDGYKYFDIVPGWHTYDLDMKNAGGPGSGHDLETVPGGTGGITAGTPWTGSIGLVYLAPAFNLPTKPTLDLEDFSIYQPSQSVNVTLPSGSGNMDLWADYDANSSNDGPASAPNDSASRIGSFAAGSTVPLGAGLFRADVPTRFYVTQSGSTSGESGPVTMASTSTPSPTVVSPSELGGTDFAASVRGDAWDFDQSSDVFMTANIWAQAVDGQLKAVTAPGSTTNDPVVVLNLGAHQIDATLFHKIAVTMNYDGPWGLEDAPGGGMVGRFVWRSQDNGTEQVSMPIVVKPGTFTYVVSFRTSPATAILDPTGNSTWVGWGTGSTTFVNQLRFDPHEDPGVRSWQIDDVKLLRDESVSPTFDIHFRDDTFAAGTTATIYADTDRDPFNGLGTVIASGYGVHAGDNVWNWNGAGVGPGPYWIHVELTRGGRTVAATSTGQVDVGMNGAGAPPATNTGAPPPPAAPAVNKLLLFYFFVLVVRARQLNTCRVAQRRHQRAVVNSPTCRALLAKH